MYNYLQISSRKSVLSTRVWRKVVYVRKFLANEILCCNTMFDRVILYYFKWQSTYKTLSHSNVEFRKGVPQFSDFTDDLRAKMIIPNDVMCKASGKSIIKLFTKGSHHRNLSILFISQNLLYCKLREVSLNSSYIVVFKNLRNTAQIPSLAWQICLENPRSV